MSCRLTGKSSRFGREDSWFEPRRDNKENCRVDELAKSPRFERGVWGFEALPDNKSRKRSCSPVEWTPPCHGGDRGFESHQDREKLS